MAARDAPSVNHCTRLGWRPLPEEEEPGREAELQDGVLQAVPPPLTRDQSHCRRQSHGWACAACLVSFCTLTHRGRGVVSEQKTRGICFHSRRSEATQEPGGRARTLSQSSERHG